MSEIKLYAPKRKQRKINVSLTEDTIKFLDDLSGAMGMSRSSFLQVFVDTHNEYMVEFVRGWLASLQFYQEESVKANKTKKSGQKSPDVRRPH